MIVNVDPRLCLLQPLVLNCREESSMQGAAIVLRTLVPNARRIFGIIAEQQIQDPEQGETNEHLLQLAYDGLTGKTIKGSVYNQD